MDNSTPVSRMLHEDEAELNRLASMHSVSFESIRGLALVQRNAGLITPFVFQQWMLLAD